MNDDGAGSQVEREEQTVPQPTGKPEPCWIDDPADGLTSSTQPVALTPWGENEWAIVIQPESDSTDLFRVLTLIPPGAQFHEAFGDVDIMLVYGPGNQQTPP